MNIPARWRLTTPLALFAVSLLLASCTTTGSDRLRVLRTDPLASVELPGSLDVRVYEMSGNPESGLGVSSPTSITHTFTVAEGTVPEAMEALVGIAREAGWDVEPNRFGGYLGDKTIDGLYSQVSIKGLEQQSIAWIEISTTDE